MGGRRLCHPFPFLGAPWGAPGHSLGLHGTSCSPRPEDTCNYLNTLCVYILAGMTVAVTVLCVPPTQDSHVPAACPCVILAGRPGSRSVCSQSP